MSKPLNISRFNKRFPNEDICLDHLMRVRYGERLTCLGCHKDAKFYRAKSRRSFACEHCGYQVYPTAGTPFEKTRTGLKDWYYVMFLFCASRNGVSSKEVQRQLGVTYKTAWRMTNLIRQYMGKVDGDLPLGGDGGVVEIDETWIGGKDRLGENKKAQVLGMVEYDNTIEAFWSNVKRGIKGTYVWVSKRHLQTYLREFEYRHNFRRQPALMFEFLVGSFSQVRLAPLPKGAR